MQNYLVKEKQSFVEDWEFPDKFLGELYPFENISRIPVSMISGSKDGLCPPSRAMILADQISTMANFIELEGKGHSIAGLSQDEFFDILLDELTEEFPDEFRYWKVNLDEDSDDFDDDEENNDDEEEPYEIVGDAA